MPALTEQQIESKHHDLQFRYIDFIRNARSFEGIKIQQYVILEMIGRGAFAQIYRGVNEVQNKQVAIKVLNLRTIEGEKSPHLKSVKKRLAEQESRIMMKFNSPHILKCYECFQNKDFKIMVIEYCNQGSLQDKIYQDGTIPENQAIYILKQIINGIGQCHRQKIIHRDLKPDNILINNGEYKIADFGFSKMLNIQNQQETTINTRLGTIITMAPQILKGQRYGLKADIWSIGVIFFHMIFGQCPFKSDTAIQMVAEIASTKLLTEKQYKGVRISQNVRKFLRQVLVVNIEKRLGWKELLNHQLFNVGNSRLADKFERQFEINSRGEQLQALSRQFQICEMSDKALFELSNNKSESLINFQKANSSQQMHENLFDNTEEDERRIGFNIQKHLPQTIHQVEQELKDSIANQVDETSLTHCQYKNNQSSNHNQSIYPQECKNQQKQLHLEQSSALRESQFLQTQEKENISPQSYQEVDRSTTQYRKLTVEQRFKVQKCIDREQTQTYKWAQRIYIQCKITENLYQKILIPIEKYNLLDLKKRQNIEFMYLVSTRCLNNMSPINDVYNKRKNNTIIQQLKDNVEKLYQKVLDIWTKYSNLLTSKQNQKLVIATDWLSKVFSRQKIKKKDRYLSGIENMLDYKNDDKNQISQKKQEDKDLLDYDKSEQISFTLDYIEQILNEIKSKQNDSKVIVYLKHYKEICLIDFDDLRKRTFDEYINLVLL